tara:strand:- start:160 stop:282 length:123 start_codon:yes stop_codon:yes gene_type:complete
MRNFLQLQASTDLLFKNPPFPKDNLKGMFFLMMNRHHHQQ